jgi:hypothetical protein
LLKLILKRASVFGAAQYVISLAILLGYLGLLRVSNYLIYSSAKFVPSKHLVQDDVTVVQGRLVLDLKWSKTRQNTERTHVVLPKVVNGLFSPVFHFKRLLKVNRSVASANKPLLLLPSGNPLRVHFFNKALKWLVFQVLGSDNGISSHTLRRSGTTYFAAAGASDTQLMRQGTWKSDCFRNYLLSGKLQPSPVQQAADVYFS